MIPSIDKKNTSTRLPVFNLPKAKRDFQLFQVPINAMGATESASNFRRSNVLLFGSETIKNFILSALPSSRPFLGLSRMSSTAWDVEPPPQDLRCKLWSIDLGNHSSFPIISGDISGAIIFFHSKYKVVSRPYINSYINFIRGLTHGEGMPIVLIDVKGSRYDFDKEIVLIEKRTIFTFMSSVVRTFFNPPDSSSAEQTTPTASPISFTVESISRSGPWTELLYSNYTKPLSVWELIKRKLGNFFGYIFS